MGTDKNGNKNCSNMQDCYGCENSTNCMSKWGLLSQSWPAIPLCFGGSTPSRLQ